MTNVNKVRWIAYSNTFITLADTEPQKSLPVTDQSDQIDNGCHTVVRLIQMSRFESPVYAIQALKDLIEVEKTNPSEDPGTLIVLSKQTILVLIKCMYYCNDVDDLCNVVMHLVQRW